MTEQILIVTSNPNKVREFREMLEPLGYQVRSLADLDDHEDVPENGSTFRENAVIKAEHGRDKYGMAAVADDSGLCIHALQEAPGVHSARFMGRSTPYEVKNRELLRRMAGKKDRRAAFHCAIAVARPQEETMVFEGIMEGEIAEQPAGDNGFGYDPIFWLPQYGKTSAQLKPEEKNAVSHRGKAVRQLLAWMKEEEK